ncbi:MAG: UPF0146 family protein [Halodesulfurarchaeum sp.]
MCGSPGVHESGRSPPPLPDVLAAHDRLVEVGIGNRTDVAAALADRGVAVTAVDVIERSVPAGVEFVRDDVTEPTLDVYDASEAIYSLRLPPDLQPPVAAIADAISVPLYFTTLGTDPPVVPTAVRTIEAGALHGYEPGPAPGRSR